jgi:hypothetical protein
MQRVDTHRIESEEYGDIPELTAEWFDKAEFSIADKVVRPAKRPGRPKAHAPKHSIALRLGF